MNEQLINEYAMFALEVRNDAVLSVPVKAQTMLQIAQALAQLVPLMAGPQAELEMRQQEHAMNLEMKRQELGMKAQEHEMKLQQSQADHQLKLQQSQDNHQNSLVQSQESHKQKLSQSPKETVK
jgi:hypothetical protein